MAAQYDHIVIGTGVIGSGAAYWLARRGGRVLALEQFEPGHDRGASTDHSRIIRHSYDELAEAQLTLAAYDAWAEIERAGGGQLVFRTGGLDLGDQATVERCAATMTAVGTAFEELDRADLGRRYPQFALPREATAVFQADAGVLDVRHACAAQLALARRHGAVVASHSRVDGIDETSTGVTVTTAGGKRYRAASVSVCAGRWLNQVLAGTGWQAPLRLQHQQASYFAAPRLEDFAIGRFPIWIWHGEPCFYGLPAYGVPAVKAAEDLGGPWIELRDEHGPPDPALRQRVERFLAERIPGALGPQVLTRVCAYELTADHRFLIDSVPGHLRVHFAVGAGHAAKFGSLIGRVLADLACDGGTDAAIDAFCASRPALFRHESPTAVPGWGEPVGS